MWTYFLEAVLGYFLGSISTSVIYTKWQYKKDVRQSGSGNAGATNVARVFGMKAGLITLLGDIIKLVIPMTTGYLLDGDLGAAVAGIAGILGHCFPVYFKFRGGKGVSVAVTMALFLDWRVFLIGISIFLLVVLLTRFVSLGSILAAVSLPVTTLIFCGGNTPKIVMAVSIAVIIVIMHRENIKRLVTGKEPKFKPKKSKETNGSEDSQRSE